MEAVLTKKIGDVLCDLGKYSLTVFPLSYFFSDKPATVYVILAAEVVGVLFVLYGLYFTNRSESMQHSVTKRKRKIKVMKNAVFVVEEERL